MNNVNNLELKKYLEVNFKIVHNAFEDFNVPNELDGECQTCNKDVFFKVNLKKHSNYSPYSYDNDPQDFYTLWLTCPRCNKNSFIQLLKLKIERLCNSKNEIMPFGFDIEEADEEEDFHTQTEFYVFSLLNIPTQEKEYSLQYIPDEQKSLKVTVAEALFCMEHKKNISAVIMFRRALQIIAKDILGAIGNTLFSQLTWLKANENLLKIDLSEIFHEYSTIIKNVGNQGAHPEDDEDLQHFTEEDVQSLHDLFLIIITEIFVKPEKLKKIKEELKSNRKLI